LPTPAAAAASDWQCGGLLPAAVLLPAALVRPLPADELVAACSTVTEHNVM
jgi:hypothetical protein